MLKYNLHKAQKEGYRVKRPSGRAFFESIRHWTVQFDREYRGLDSPVTTIITRSINIIY